MKPIRNLRELELVKQNLNYKVLHLEDKLRAHSEATIDILTNRLRVLALETGMKLVLTLLQKKGKNKAEKTVT